jgi:type III restriction enzyme
MKLQFKVQQYQTEAVDAVVDVFAAQPYADGVKYRIDPGKSAMQTLLEDSGLRNAEVTLSKPQLLTNVHAVQQARGLALSKDLVTSPAAPYNLDVEMETGTGKTYVYTKTIMELHKRYGWSKYIVVVPSIAIREGVKKSFDITAEHFQQFYGTKPRTFVYNSSRLHELERFSSDSGVQVMIINIHAFNATGADARRIYEVLDDFQSRRPIDVIAANRPILIIDEPQKIEGDAKKASKSLEALGSFNALFALRYSATHKIDRTKVHRLDALDAYNQKLVKRIAVRGITIKGLAGSTAYLYVDGLEVGKGADFPKARVELEVQTKGGPITRKTLRVQKGSRLHDLSGEIEAYKNLVVVDVDANRDIIELSDGSIIGAGEVTEDITDDAKRRIQIREVIRAHLDKERELYAQGIKVLSLFFIDEVAKYRDYRRDDTLGDYARAFQQEYEALVADFLAQLDLDEASERYRSHLESIPVGKTHQGYFSIDKKTGHSIDGSVKKTGETAGQSDDVDAYDLILKDKERLLSFEEPVRFIWSHSALREGWDNPNVFVMGMLKKSDNTTTRRQEIGRGLRLSVNQHGDRTDNPVTVHDINELTVVTDESYTAFVTALQKEIVESLSARPRKASVDYFMGKSITTESGTSVIEQAVAQALYHHLIRHDYIDDLGLVTDTYKEARAAGTLVAPTSEALKPIIDFVLPLVDALYLEVPTPTDGRKPKRIPLNQENFAKKEFQELWDRINHKSVYQVEFDSAELISKCIQALDKSLKVSVMQYVVQKGVQLAAIGVQQLEAGEAFKLTTENVEGSSLSAGSTVKYDLLREIAEKTQLTRRTCAAILAGVNRGTFAKFKQNPEQFITEAARLTNEQKATMIVEHLAYDPLDDRYDSSIFTDNQTAQDLSKAGEKLKKSVYEYVVTDSKVERSFVTELDTSADVVVYSKLPRGLFIPTPVGEYNPDWAIAFQHGKVKHVYFVAETKGSMSTLQLRGVEEAKIECVRKFFKSLNDKADTEKVTYEVVSSYDGLLQLVHA